MKASLSYAIAIFAFATSPIPGQQNLDSLQKDSIQKMEASGDTMGARTALARAAQANPNNIAAWTAYAEFLDRYGDPGAHEAYTKLLTVLTGAADTTKAARVARRLALLDLVHGDRGAASRSAEPLRAHGGERGWTGR